MRLVICWQSGQDARTISLITFEEKEQDEHVSLDKIGVNG